MLLYKGCLKRVTIFNEQLERRNLFVLMSPNIRHLQVNADGVYKIYRFWNVLLFEKENQ
jgi:hypothetical protein